jgi:hypothetical protein
MALFHVRPDPHPSSVELKIYKEITVQKEILQHYHLLFSICNLDQKRKGEDICHIKLIFNAIIELVYKVFIEFILLYTGRFYKYTQEVLLKPYVLLYTYFLTMCKCVAS